MLTDRFYLAAVFQVQPILPMRKLISAKTIVLAMLANVCFAQPKAQFVKPENSGINKYYNTNQAPLQPQYFTKLPVGSVKPGGWLLKNLQLQQTGLTGNLGEISVWLSKKDNAWLAKDGKGKYGWEELPYWLKGYADIGYVLNDPKMIKESRFWIEAVLSNQRPDGDFGPDVLKKGKRDLWTNMPMLWCLQSYYEYSNDKRVLAFMTKYFKWELSVPDEDFLKDFWEKSRGGDNLLSVYWLYNHTGDKFLLDLATKIDKNTADWRQADNLPNWHNVNIAESFREPATYFEQSKKKADLAATYNDFILVRQLYGQVPGGMFGADENARKGYSDPRQAVETCGMVEQMTSDQVLLNYTGDIFWADNCEDVAFNTFPAAFMPDYKSLRYLTAPNMVLNDDKNHSPGIDNSGPFLMMNPFSSRCCQHNHAAGWVYYNENSWAATPDNGLAAQLYTEGVVSAKVANGATVKIIENTHYPFDDKIRFTVQTTGAVNFPVYLRIPKWCSAPVVAVNGQTMDVKGGNSTYIKLNNTWKNGDQITLQLPMKLSVKEWDRNKNSVSVSYGPLTYSLLIQETYVQKSSKKTAMGDSGWQPGANEQKWPSFEIHPASAWNYGLLVDADHPEKSFTVVKKKWPVDNNPFTNKTAPIQIKATGKLIPNWTIDQYGLCGVLPQSPVKADGQIANLTLVPMGGARLRISSFPVIKN
jgi:Beta-L-arabinofuranosidase, GH127